MFWKLYSKVFSDLKHYSLLNFYLKERFPVDDTGPPAVLSVLWFDRLQSIKSQYLKDVLQTTHIFGSNIEKIHINIMHLF